MPEIYLYEYPVQDISFDDDQPVTLLSVDDSVSLCIARVLSACKKRENSHNPPTTWMQPILMATVMGFVRPLKWDWDGSVRHERLLPAILLGERPDLNAVASIFHSWTSVWRDYLRQSDPAAQSDAEALLTRVAQLWADNELLTTRTCRLSEVTYKRNGEFSPDAYDLLPGVILNQLAGSTTRIDIEGDHRAVWGMVHGRDDLYATTQLLTSQNGGPFAYKLTAELETVPNSRGEHGVIHLKLSQQRFPDGSITKVPENDHSVLLRTGERQWCKVSIKDYGQLLRREAKVGALALPEWDSLPELKTLQDNPALHLDTIRIVYLTGMRFEQDDEEDTHPLQVGMSFAEERSVLGPVIESLGLPKPTPASLDTELTAFLNNVGRLPEGRAIWSHDRVKGSQSTDTAVLLTERIRAATDGKGLELVLVAPQRHTQLVEKILPNALKYVFQLEELPDFLASDYLEIIDGVTCRIVRLAPEHSALFEKFRYEDISRLNHRDKQQPDIARWRPLYSRRYEVLLEVLRGVLPLGDGPVRLALVDKPAPPSANYAPWLDVKGAIRAALGELGYLSQFMNPYYTKKNGTEGLMAGVDYRVRQGILDGLRQLSVVMGEPGALYEYLGMEPVTVVSVALVQTQYKDIQFPVFSRLKPGGRAELCFRDNSGRLTSWQPGYQATPALVRFIWSTLDALKEPGTYRQGKKAVSPLRMNEGHIVQYLEQILAAARERTLLLVPAEVLRGKKIWPQLQNGRIGVEQAQLCFGNNRVIERGDPRWNHLIGVVRFRGPGDEVPEYYPTQDRTGTSRDYLAPHGWYRESDGVLRYMGVGVILSTKSNRERIHYDAHSLLHEKRKWKPDSNNEYDAGAAQRYGHSRLIEYVPFFVHEELGPDGALALCRLAHLTRSMGWHEITLSQPWPSHLATTALADALDVIGRYRDIG